MQIKELLCKYSKHKSRSQNNPTSPLTQNRLLFIYFSTINQKKETQAVATTPSLSLAMQSIGVECPFIGFKTSLRKRRPPRSPTPWLPPTHHLPPMHQPTSPFLDTAAASRSTFQPTPLIKISSSKFTRQNTY